MKERLNIGLLVDDIDAVFTNESCKGAVLAAHSIDANMFIFPGGYLDPEDISDEHLKYEYQYNTLFSFACNKHLDVLYIMMGMIAGRVQDNVKFSFLEQFLGIPVVALYTKMDGYTSATFDNRIGFSKAIRHLIVDHHVTKIGYVSGPKTNVDAMERMDTFKQVLTEEQIPIVDDYIIYGNFEESSETIIRELVEQHPEIEALVFANDRMALGGYRAFRKMGLRVGDDILVVGFDNSVFAPTLNPPLSTVEANAAELSYQAIYNTKNFLKTKKMESMEVNTHFIKRASCGCNKFDSEGISDLLGFDHTTQKENINMDAIHNYLFGTYLKGENLQQIKDDISVLVKMLFEINDDTSFALYQKDLEILFVQLINSSLLQYTTVELFFNFLIYMQQALTNRIDHSDGKLLIVNTFSKMYRDLAMSNCQVVQEQQQGLDRISHIMNNMTAGMFRMEAESDIPYEIALKNLSSVGIHSAYLFTYPNVINHPRGKEWHKPGRLVFQAYCDSHEVYSVPEDQQLISTDQLFHNPYIITEHARIMVVSPLFSGNDLYGILLSEVDFKDFGNIASISFQISAALKSLSILEEQQAIQTRMANNLNQIKENNQRLSVISQSDELTGLYNRRGFLEHAQAVINNKKNQGKRALIIYADMDNLKMVNDKYGHEEGDFALKEIASILRDVFRRSDIVARLGGDEFTALALTNIEDYQNIMHRRINEITLRHNKACDKPYPIEMSVGIHEFVCDPAVDIYELLTSADELLYAEKKRKKGLSY
ncbi:MAG: GGDEF domain-containing protein [Clostridium sp.]|nr:GGDEF domain-containing protein [Clostridium sp.]MCM1399470.1 GGDEF domain-containing protein [Clostridium sp.]MCM1460024.1 GGDEF domain-containing protein [Bacteroides sp.]